MTSQFFVENIDIGTKLEEIKNNKSNIFKPIIILSNTTLSTNQFLNILQNGLVVDITMSNITINLPSAVDIQKALLLSKYQQIDFKINSFTSILPNTNTVTLISGTGLTFPDGNTLTTQQSRILTLICQSESPPLFYVS